MIRTLHIVGSMNRGGVETWLMHVLRSIDRTRFQMDFAVNTTKPGAYDEEIRRLGSNIYPCLHHKTPFLYAKNLKKIVDEHGPYDIIHSHVHFYSGWVLFVAAQLGIPVRIAHSHTNTRKLQKSAGYLRKMYLTGMRFLIKRYATTGIAISNYAAQSLFGLEWENDKRWHIVYYGIDFSPFFKGISKIRTRKELGIFPDEKVIGVVGRFSLDNPKNYFFWIQIAREIYRKEPNAKFLLVGDGPLRSKVEAQVEEWGIKDAFVFLGSRPDVPVLMKGAMDIFLLPSLYEGFGLVVLEAQAAGLPIVMSDVIPSEVDVVPQLIHRLSLNLSPAQWAEVVLQVLKNRKSYPSPEESLKRVMNSEFTVEKSVKHLTALYEEALKDVR